MTELNKLVRDKVPYLVAKDGGSYSLKLLSPLEHRYEITKKKRLEDAFLNFTILYLQSYLIHHRYRG